MRSKTKSKKKMTEPEIEKLNAEAKILYN